MSAWDDHGPKSQVRRLTEKLVPTRCPIYKSFSSYLLASLRGNGKLGKQSTNHSTCRSIDTEL